MPFDVFTFRDRVVADYADYFRSFVTIDDPDIERYVEQQLREGAAWPDAVLQLNPAYEAAATLGELARDGTITPETARFFGPDLRLHRHQADALAIARRGEPYVVSTGTGSGKSLTYLIPIVDSVFRRDPARATVRAVIVYPMNALINSQLQALESFREKNWPDCPVRFDRYTGQDNQAARQAILERPPHILLTNYVMLEYVLIRPSDRSLVERMVGEFQFLVMDELHIYRGRQGADVAMLMRRLRQRVGNRRVQFIGTSATLATEGNRERRSATIAGVGSTLFGVAIPPGNVVDETLRRVTTVRSPATPDHLRRAVQAPPPGPGAITDNPLAAWVEDTFGLAEIDGRLQRRTPHAGHLLAGSGAAAPRNRDRPRGLRCRPQGGPGGWIRGENRGGRAGLRLSTPPVAGVGTQRLRHPAAPTRPAPDLGRAVQSAGRREPAALSPGLLPGMRAGILPGGTS